MNQPHDRQDIYRRRRFAAALAGLFTILLAIVGINAASGGTGEEGVGRSELPTAHSRAWAAEREARIQAAEDQAALDETLVRTPVLRHGGGNKPLIALTFDDGPGQDTPEILEILDRYDVKATFFVIGGAHDAFGELIKEELTRGHVVANHTVDHPEMDSLPPRRQAKQIDDQSRAIELFGGFTPRLFRPPYNSWGEETLALLKRREMLMVLWSVETGDWAKPGADAIVEHTMSAVEPGSIVLMHDGGGDRAQTVEALPRIIDGLQNSGYELVTVPRLLREDPPVADQSP